MKRTLLVATLGWLLMSGAALAEGDGQAIFMAQKCNTCHSVSSVGIESKTKAASMVGPDLAKVAAELDPEWMAKYLKKQEKREGKDHKKEYKGSDGDLETLISWLRAQKAE